MRTKNVLRRLVAAAAVTGLIVSAGPTVPAVAAGGPNLATGKATSASSVNGPYVTGNLNDGNKASYWESSGALPQHATIDLGSSTSVDQVRLKLPDGWGARTQTLSIQGSPDGVTYSTLKASAGYVFDPATANTVTIDFTAASVRFVRAGISANTGWAAAQLSEFEVYGVSSGGSGNLAAGKAMSESGHSDVYGAGNANDGNKGSYWESVNNAWPQHLTVDLAAAVSVNRVVLKLPDGWGARTQTLKVQGSTNGSTFSDITASAGHVFNPATANTVTINFNALTTRHVRLSFTGNTVWPAGQISEFEVYGPSTGDTTPPSAPTNLAYIQQGAGQIQLNWNAATDNVGVTGYDIYANGTLKASVNGSTLTYTDSQPITATVSYYVKAKDAAGNQSGNSNTVTRTGSDASAPTVPTNLAYTEPAAGQIRLAWNAATDNVGVTGYDIYANGVLRASTNGSTLFYVDSQPSTATVSYYVRAKDAAGNVSANSNTVTRTGIPGGDTQAPTVPGNLAYSQPSGGQIQLTWTASTDNVAVTGYDVYANGSLRASTNGSTLSYLDSQPSTATVQYYVRAKDAAGNQSGNSNVVTRPGVNPPGDNLAQGKPIEANSSVFTFIAANANDGSVTTYWEGAGGSYPNNLTVKLGSNATVSSVVLKLDPAGAWATRTQTIQVQGREQSASGYTNLTNAVPYVFNPATANTVTIPITATAADVRLVITSNTGSAAGQIAEFQVIGVPAPNPDLVVNAMSFSPASPVETTAITLSATARNNGTAAAAATSVNFYLGSTLVGNAAVPALAAGAQTTVSASIGARDAASYQLSSKIDESNAIIEQNDANNTYVNPTNLVVSPVASSDLIAVSTSWSPGNPSGGQTVTFTTSIKNQGTVASAGGAHNVTLTVTDNVSGAVVKTSTAAYTGVINAGATSPQINLGTWTAVNGKYTVKTVIATDANELPVKVANNTATQGFFVGRGANLGYDMYEAEDGTWGGGAAQVGPNRTIGDLGGEASGRKAVTLNSTGAYVQWTTKAATNTLVTRFSIPDGPDSSVSIYVNNVFHKSLPLTAKYIWLYGNEAEPSNSPGAGPRHLYDEANTLLNSTVPAGSVIKLQKDSGNAGNISIDFINTELVAPKPNPNPATYITPAGTSQQQVQAAFDAARQSATAVGVYLPAGVYETSNKFSVYGKAVDVVGAGQWYTRFQTPQGQANTDAGFRVETSADGSKFRDLAFFGNYDIRQNGPGKVWGELKNNKNLTFDNIWVEHTVCMYWGVANDNIKITNTKIRNTWADGVNFTSDTQNTLISNVEGRSNGDDAFALFSAIDGGGSVGNHGNVFENLTATLTWRAAGLAVYGGYDNVFRNMYIADMLTYSGITISSLDFGYPFVGFGANPPTRFENISLVRSGGHFWGQQAFGAIWVFSASKEFRGIRVTDVDIIDPTYTGIMFQTIYNGATPGFPVTDTVFTNVRISGVQKSGDAFDSKSGYGIWVNEMPEPGQGPAVGSATFVNTTFTNVFQNVKNTTSTFTLNGLTP